MKNIVIRFGLLSGFILAAMSAVMMPLCFNGTIDFAHSELLGYSSMVVAFLMVFFGIRTYREREGNGAITFGRAFKVGILICLITCAIYVIAWEIVYYGFIPDFMETYAKFTLEKMRAAGASAETMATKQAEMAKFAELYRNPLVNVAVTFMEVFPVGLIVTLVSAAILRTKAEEVAL